MLPDIVKKLKRKIALCGSMKGKGSQIQTDLLSKFFMNGQKKKKKSMVDETKHINLNE